MKVFAILSKAGYTLRVVQVVKTEDILQMKKIVVTSGMAMALAFANLASGAVIFGTSPLQTIGTGGFTGDTEYTYAVSLDGKEQFTNGSTVEDAYCIAGLQGFVSAVALVATPGFAQYSGTSGGCTSALAPDPMNAGVTNLDTGAWIEVIYTGTATIAASSALPSVSFYSIYGEAVISNTPFGGRAQLVSDGTNAANQGDVLGPSSTAPEPGTMALFGSALLGIGFFARKRIKKG